MAVASSSASKGQVSSPAAAQKHKEKKSKRTKCPGVRVHGSRIYDSENGKTCHQCRQKTMDFMAACKNLKKEKQCTIKFCHKCLLNRYGEKAEDVALLDDWNCPKCRDTCNCSFCMKKRGHKPTGQLVHTAKATGFSSVSELLQTKGYDNSSHEKEIAKDMVVSPKKSLMLKKESGAASLRKPGKENSFDGGCDSNVNSQNLSPSLSKKKSKKMKRVGLKKICNSNGEDDVSLREKSPKRAKVSEEIAKKEKLKVCEDISKLKKPKISNGNLKKKEKTNESESENHESIRASNGVKKCNTEIPNKEFVADIQLPQGASLTTVAGIEIPPEDIGNALQFLEFCAAFGKVLNLKKRQPECIIRELMRGRSRRRGQSFPMIQIHIQLLSLIQKDMGEESPSLSSTNGTNSWLQALSKCVSESKCASSDVPSNCFNKGGDGYDTLDGSEKLKLLNFLCDEALGTTTLRTWIGDQNFKFVENVKESREKFVAAKEKEKQLKQKLQDEVAKAIIAKNSAPLSVSEHEAMVSEIKIKAAEAHFEMVAAMGMASNKRQRSDAVRTEPILIEDNGRAFWRLKCYGDEPDILLQDTEGTTQDAVSPKEKWFVYDADKVPEVEKYISSTGVKRARAQKDSSTLAIAGI